MKTSIELQHKADRRAQQQSERLELLEKAVHRTVASPRGPANSSPAIGSVVERQTDDVQHKVQPTSTDGSAVHVMAPPSLITDDASASDGNTQEDQFEGATA